MIILLVLILVLLIVPAYGGWSTGAPHQYALYLAIVVLLVLIVTGFVGTTRSLSNAQLRQYRICPGLPVRPPRDVTRIA